MSSIQKVPVDILLDLFQANEPVDVEALQLTCRRFHFTILQNVDTLPTRLVCDLDYVYSRVHVYRAAVDAKHGRYEGDHIAVADESPTELQDMHETIGRKATIRTVAVSLPLSLRLPNAPLVYLIKHFPSASGAVRLDIKNILFVLPTDAVLNRFVRLETIVMDPYSVKESSFWSDLFASKAFRRVPNVIAYHSECHYQEEVDHAALFDFLTDFSLMPKDKPRMVKFGHFTDDSIDALKHRFYKNIASIGGEVCAIISGAYHEQHYLTNMASGSQKKTLAKQLLNDAYNVPAVNHN